MPHLAPLNWLIIPLLIIAIIYTQIILFYFHQPTGFPNININNYNISPWNW